MCLKQCFFTIIIINGNSAGIKLTQLSILRFFALQGPLVLTLEATEFFLRLVNSYIDRFIFSKFRPKNTKNHEICKLCRPAGATPLLTK